MLLPTHLLLLYRKRESCAYAYTLLVGTSSCFATSTCTLAGVLGLMQKFDNASVASAERQLLSSHAL